LASVEVTRVNKCGGREKEKADSCGGKKMSGQGKECIGATH